MFDVPYQLSKKEDKQKIRVPLTCLIDYKGFRCLAAGVLPIQQVYTPIVLDSDKYLEKFMHNVGFLLNLKSNKNLQSNKTYQNVPISSSV